MDLQAKAGERVNEGGAREGGEGAGEGAGAGAGEVGGAGAGGTTTALDGANSFLDDQQKASHLFLGDTGAAQLASILEQNSSLTLLKIGKELPPIASATIARLPSLPLLLPPLSQQSYL
jgi:hypothetical protein